MPNNIDIPRFDTSQVNFTNFEAADLTDAQEQSITNNAKYAAKLAEAYEQAIANARDAGNSLVTPQDTVWLPTGLPQALADAADPDGDGLVTLEFLQQAFAAVGFEATKAGGVGILDRPVSISVAERQTQDLLDYAAQQRSLLPRDAGGGILVENGRFYFGGVSVPQRTVFFAVRLNQIDNLEKSIAARLGEINESNDKVRQANEFLEALRASRPADSESKVNIGTNTTWEELSDQTWETWVGQFEDNYGYDPFAEFTTYENFADVAGGTGVSSKELTYNAWDAIIEAVKARVSSINSENQIKQVSLERLNNQRSEVTDAISKNTSAYGQTETGIAQNT